MLAALGRLAANIGHEINNPLSFVIANLALSLDALEPAAAAGPSPDVELAELKRRLPGVCDMLRECQIGSERIRETVSNLQRLSRSDEERRVTFDVQALIEQSVSIAWNEIRHRARLVKYLGKLPPMRGNGVALGQVFLNLLLNAAQAIPEGAAESNEIRISSRVQAGEKGDEIVVEIADSGAGIAPDNLSRVFEPFFTTKPQGQGTGLGLSISRQTVLDHGGRLTIDSAVGKGSTFRVFLPAVHALTVAPVARVSPLSSVAMRARLLIIDDEPAVGRVIEMALKRDHDVVVVQRAPDALARLAEDQTFDLILCDVVMPDLSGPQFYATVAERWPALVRRLVFMTGGAFTPDTTAFLQHLGTPVLSKPFRIEALKELINGRLEEQRL
jgi:CheY-like chemotaxis protein